MQDIKANFDLVPPQYQSNQVDQETSKKRSKFSFMFEGGADTYGQADDDIMCCYCIDGKVGMKILCVLNLITGFPALFTFNPLPLIAGILMLMWWRNDDAKTRGYLVCA